jgi:hypothetical protein
MDPNAAAVVAVPAVASFIEPPLYDVNHKTAAATIGTLPTFHPRLSHANIRALEQDLFKKLEMLQSMQSKGVSAVSPSNRPSAPSSWPCMGAFTKPRRTLTTWPYSWPHA